MKNNKDLNTNQILKYLNKEMTESEIIELKKLLQDQKNLALFKKHIAIDHYIQLNKNDFDSQKAASLFQKHIQSTKPSSKTDKNRSNNYLKYAAIFIGLILGSTFIYNKLLYNTDEIITEVTLQQGDGNIETLQDDELFKEIKNEDGIILAFQEKNKIIYNTKDNDSISKEKTVINTLRVPYGKKIQLVLSDGTIVHVNAGSTLKFPSKFLSGHVREVTLSGEAYFEIARNEKDPFIVSTNGIKTEVLGTKFNVSSYADDSFSEVVLIEGSVGVFKNKNRFDKNTDKILAPNQKASLLKTSQSLNISNVKTENYIAWVDGVLVFKNESFEIITKKLERFYNKKITINYQNIKTEKFTGRFDVENIESVLKTFKSNTFFNYHIKENEIIINP